MDEKYLINVKEYVRLEYVHYASFHQDFFLAFTRWIYYLLNQYLKRFGLFNNAKHIEIKKIFIFSNKKFEFTNIERFREKISFYVMSKILNVTKIIHGY